MGVTQRDVAARAGVSPVVVSRVLHNKATSVRVSAATAERVRKAAEELNYRRNVSAQNFRLQQTNTIGILHGLGFARPEFDGASRYFARLMDGMIEGAFEHEYAVTLCPKLLGENPIDAMGDGRFDGMVWYSTQKANSYREIIDQSTVPLVVIHAHAADLGQSRPTVICDNDQGIELAVSHLVQLGHRSIAFAVGEEDMNGESFERYHAFQRHMGLRTLPVGDADLVTIGRDLLAADQYFRQGPRHTAMIAHTDWTASHLIKAATRHGVRIPDEFSIVGFDSTAYCEELRPSLTSVAQPIREIGRKAIDLLARLIKGDPTSVQEVVLPCGFDVRESTAPPPIR